jgi:dUTP pyrophosphatase
MSERIVFLDLEGGIEPPKYATSESAGADLRANIDTEITLEPLQRVLIPTGIKMSLPNGYEGQVRPRSGLAYKHGITVLNAPGTIDEDYRGDVGVILVNLSKTPYTIQPDERIAQLVVAKYEQVHFQDSDFLTETSRGEGGFGSTGKQ